VKPAEDKAIQTLHHFAMQWHTNCALRIEGDEVCSSKLPSSHPKLAEAIAFEPIATD
jgi:hypothetical protein